MLMDAAARVQSEPLHAGEIPIDPSVGDVILSVVSACQTTVGAEQEDRQGRKEVDYVHG